MKSVSILRPILRRTAKLLRGTTNCLSEQESERAVIVWVYKSRENIKSWSRHPKKIEMREKVDRVLLALNEIHTSLNDEQVIDACGEVWLAALPKKSDRKLTGQTDIQYRALNDIERNRKTLLKSAELMKTAFEYMFADFQLTKKEGRFRAWSHNHLEPKQFATLLMMQLFMAVRGIVIAPGPNNLDFVEFLSLVWELISGEADITDWSTPIRVARGEPYIRYHERFHARHAAQLVVNDLLEELRDYVKGFRQLKKGEFKPPPLVPFRG